MACPDAQMKLDAMKAAMEADAAAESRSAGLPSTAGTPLTGATTPEKGSPQKQAFQVRPDSVLPM
jgi:hypothetical protein